MRIAIVTFLISLLGPTLHGQEWTFYLDSCENFVSENDYVVKRIVKNQPETKFAYIFSDFYKNGQLVTTGIAKSRNGKTKDGDFIFYHENGQQFASGKLYKDLMKGKWMYLEGGSEIEKDELVEKLPQTTFLKDSILSTGKCLCYRREGIWHDTSLKNNITIERHFEDGQQISENGIYTVKDDTAMYKAGIAEFYKYLLRELKYPFMTRLKGRHGKVFVQFTIDKDGNLINPTFLVSLDKPTERKIKKVLLSTSGQWNPAKYKGKNVGSMLTLPVIFKFK